MNHYSLGLNKEHFIFIIQSFQLLNDTTGSNHMLLQIIFICYIRKFDRKKENDALQQRI